MFTMPKRIRNGFAKPKEKSESSTGSGGNKRECKDWARSPCKPKKCSIHDESRKQLRKMAKELVVGK
jgi:hypothetical protein